MTNGVGVAVPLTGGVAVGCVEGDGACVAVPVAVLTGGVKVGVYLAVNDGDAVTDKVGVGV